MNNINEQIISAFEQSDEISLDMLFAAFPNYSPEAIKLILASGSVKYRKMIKKDPQIFDDQTEEMARMAMLGLLGSNEGHLVFKAAKYVLDDRKGRHDVKSYKNLNVNIISIEERMNRARKALANSKAMQLKEQPIIDIEEAKAA